MLLLVKLTVNWPLFVLRVAEAKLVKKVADVADESGGEVGLVETFLP